MFILSTFGYVLIGATISWASPALITAGDVSNSQIANHTNEQRELGINCRGQWHCAGWRGRESGTRFLTDLIGQLRDDIWYSNGVIIGTSSFT